MASHAPRVHPQHALAVYVESLAVGQRVAVFGDASLGLGRRLADLGARSVCVWDPDPQRARREAEHSQPGVVVRSWPHGDFDQGGGGFDLAVVADLELFDDAENLLALVRRMVGDDGVALVAAPNRDATGDVPAFDYYELFDVVAREFADVTMIAQLPFFGVALAELGERGGDSPPVSVDTQLAGTDRAPDTFIALGSQRGVRLDPYAIVELTATLAAADADALADAARSRAALMQAELRARALEGEVVELRSRFADAERVVRATQKLDEALRDRSSRVAELGTLLEERTIQLAQISVQMERMRPAAEAGRMATEQLEALALRADLAERTLAAFEPELATLSDAHAAEIVRFEEALRDRAQALQLLETELARRERMVRELIDAVQESSHITAPAPTLDPAEASEHDVLVEENVRLRNKLDALALDLARRAGDAQASAWSIAELERRLESLRTAAPSMGPPSMLEPDAAAHLRNTDRDAPATDGGALVAAEARLAAALDELDVLRRALAQEHEARVHAESRDKPIAATTLEQPRERP